MKQKANLVALIAVLAFGAGHNAHASLNISNAPLFLVTPVKPALIVALDDSGSMDGEIILPTNDGAAWWNTNDQTYIGRGFNAADGSDVAAAGEFNFNWGGGANRTWKKTVYLFPNGTGSNQGRRRYGDDNNDHFALPPLPQYAWARSPSYNAQYFNPDSNYPPYPSTEDQTFDQINPRSAPWDPVLGDDDFTVDLTGTIASDNNNWLFRMYDGKIVPAGTRVDPDFSRDRGRACEVFPSNDWQTVAADTEIVADDPDDYCPMGIEYFPATFWIKADEVDDFIPADYGFVNANRLTANSGPVSGAAARSLMYGYEIKPGNFTSVEAYTIAIQNFANWFSYYRKRSMTLRGAIGRAFAPFTFLRVGNFTINDLDPVDMADLQNANEKNEFLDWAYELRGDGGTPNRQAVRHMGREFKRDGSNAPILEACQRNFGMLFTDGYATTWTGAGVGNADSGQPPPIGDGNSNTLADIAYSFYANNLRPDLEAGKVKVPAVCSEASPPLSANCQSNLHMNLFGVSMGGDGIFYNVDEAATADPWNNPPSWIDPNAQRNPSAIDDLWHATLNTRGKMFSARSPDDVAEAIQSVLSTIASLTTPVGVAANSTRLDTESLIFQSTIDSETWSGDVRAQTQDLDIVWRASEELPDDFDERNLYTWDSSTGLGVAFDSSIGDALKARILANIPNEILDEFIAEPALGDPGNAVIDYVRGNQLLEQPTGPLRQRESLIGDIANSLPVFAGSRNEGWSRVDDDYAEFVEDEKSTRPSVLYVGANAGMMHAFDAETGEELFGYIPSSVHGKLPALVDPEYDHEFYVDGQFAVGDAKGSSGWTTTLVGSLAAGGQGVFALDIGSPDSFNPSTDVLWEFTSEDDPDIGNPFGRPVISRLEDGTWVAVFGNGYNSEDEQAYLYVVDLFDGPSAAGEPLYKIPLGAAGDNGLSGVVGLPDPSTRGFLKRIYAGDLNGTIWRVDFNSSVPSVVYSDGLFTAPSGNAITATPSLAAHPDGGLMVYTGTGKLIEVDDRTDLTERTFYAIRDQNTAVGGIANLGQVVISEASPEPGLPPQLELDAVDGFQPGGWYMPLTIGGTANGQRVLSKPRVVFGRVILTSFEPNDDNCLPGGIQRLYVADALTGRGRLTLPGSSCQTCGGFIIGSGAPSPPPILIKRPTPPDGDAFVDIPVLPDPDDPDPGDPDDPAGPGGAAGRAGWCSQIGVWKDGLIVFGSVCEGRQVWRQIR